MFFDPENLIVKLCARGMELEGEQDAAALEIFLQAWQQATNDFEKFIAAHYVARRQSTPAEKLKWDQLALDHALKANEPGLEGALPSLYLNIGKCYEDLSDWHRAGENYQLALFHAAALPEADYGKLIRNGILNGIERIKNR